MKKLCVDMVEQVYYDHSIQIPESDFTYLVEYARDLGYVVDHEDLPNLNKKQMKAICSAISEMLSNNDPRTGGWIMYTGDRFQGKETTYVGFTEE